jgi:GTP cyclohydrolase I
MAGKSGALKCKMSATSFNGECFSLAPRGSCLNLEWLQVAFDQQKIEDGVRMILEGLLKTPARVARMYAEVFAGMEEDPTQHFETLFDEGHEEMVIVRDIPFYSMCEHHLVPFFGTASIAYIPGASGKICGLSKLARLVDAYAKRPQVQERLTSQVAETLVEQLNPRGVMVVIEAEHMCMNMRGVKKPGSKTTTSAVRGAFETHPEVRAEALNLLK